LRSFQKHEGGFREVRWKDINNYEPKTVGSTKLKVYESKNRRKEKKKYFEGKKKNLMLKLEADKLSGKTRM